MRKNLITGLLLMGTLAACKNDDDDNTKAGLNQTDRNFIMKASYGNNAEVDAGQSAATKGNNAGVRMFGQMMVSDHGTAQAELQMVAQQIAQTVPQGLDSMHQVMKQYLSGMSGHSFDTAYMHAQIKDHQSTINLMQDEINNGSNQRLRDYATKYLPKIQMHYHMADSISLGL